MSSHRVRVHGRGRFTNHDRQNEEPREDEFLVFGYSAKLHNASEMGDGKPFDEDKHLIPWNGDDQLKIDRYDARLYLNSLNEFDEKKKMDKTKTNEEDDDEEKDVSAEKLEEELCEEQRYMDLYLDIQRKEIEEEETKRNSKKGAEIGFQYDDGHEKDEENAADEEEVEEEENEPFEKPESLKLPVGIAMPETMRQNALIERTAVFIVDRGPQMEVLIKAKQRQNSEQFGFLDFDHRLHPYYKYLCKLIREKKYTPNLSKTVKKKKPKTPSPFQSSSESNDSEEEGGYLHPLLRGARNKTTASTPETGFIGPSPRPIQPSKKAIQKSDESNLDTLVEQLHRSSGNENSVYSSLLKGLHSLLPGKEDEGKQSDEPATNGENKEVSKMDEQQLDFGMRHYETDEAKIIDYNKWHMEFYGRPSPYLPGPPPLPQAPLPDSAVESGITVAAKYVAFHGAAAEQRLIEHNGDKVHFLLARSPYYTFYQARVRQLQWQIFQQSQQQQTSNASQRRTSTDTFSSLPSSSSIPPISLLKHIPPPMDQQSHLVPIELSLDGKVNTDLSTDGMEITDQKQLERKEKARLFMERILNERMAEKHRKTTKAPPNTDESEGKVVKYEQFEDKQNVTSKSNTSISPYHLSKAISTLIDQQIKMTFSASSSSASPAATSTKRKKEKSDYSSTDDEDERKKRRKRKEGRGRDEYESSYENKKMQISRRKNDTSSDDEDDEKEDSRGRRHKGHDEKRKGRERSEDHYRRRRRHKRRRSSSYSNSQSRSRSPGSRRNH